MLANDYVTAWLALAGSSEGWVLHWLVYNVLTAAAALRITLGGLQFAIRGN